MSDRLWSSRLGSRWLTFAALSAAAMLNTMDPEQRPAVEKQLQNDTVRSITWRGVTVTVQDRETRQARTIVDDTEGVVEAGQCCALMGPSGSGKTTLLRALARRPTHAHATDSGMVLINGQNLRMSEFRQMTSFVEGRDALIGSLTVSETLAFASRLSVTSGSATRGQAEAKAETAARITALVKALGLSDRADTLVGTPGRHGLSDGQKRRVSIASRLITQPKILFLDEPTSGLDSVASFEVVDHLRKLAQVQRMIVVCSIHQPSSSILNLFDRLLLLSEGCTHYFGPVGDVAGHYERAGVAVPQRVNPAEFVLDMTSIDFAADKALARERLAGLQAAWADSRQASQIRDDMRAAERSGGYPHAQRLGARPGWPRRTGTLLHRGLIKGCRDVRAYGIRAAMYVGLALMMGTVWLRLKPRQESIQPYINAIFFGSAFMSFMAVAYVPAFLEDHHLYICEQGDGLYGPSELVLANMVVGLPFLFAIAVLFSALAFWLANLRPSPTAFLTWLMWLFLDLLAAESLVVFAASLIPNFVMALAAVAFMNGLWMSVGGFMAPPTMLNGFYKYGFHYWDYQKYVFEGLMVNEFAERTYDCGEGCHFMYPSALSAECKIAGNAVLAHYGFTTGKTGQHVAILLAIIAGYIG